MTVRSYTLAALTIAALALISIVYWPVYTAALVWDDKFYLHDRAWLRDSAGWLQAVLHGFPDWKIFFRPLGVALFTAETRLFNGDPAHMHLLSLGLHLLNTFLVGVLARRLLRILNPRVDAGMLWIVAMLVYGLHPALIEPVAWVSSQVDLLVTLFTLLGLLANISLSSRLARSLVVAVCFFLAACSKEVAVSFPLLLLVIDWLRPVETHATRSFRQMLSARLKQQWPVYLSTLAAGVAYLAIRHWGLGSLAAGNGYVAWLTAERLNMVCFTYLAYWKLLVWPMAGLSPLHMAYAQQFAGFEASSSAIDVAAIMIASIALYLLYQRKPLGGLMAGVTAALLPVLNILPITFDDSIYHERYATTAIAIACALLPATVACAILKRRRLDVVITCSLLCGSAWLLLAIVNIRVTLPLWSDEVRLWKWAMQENPGSILAQDSLLSTYIERNDVTDAKPLADALMHDGRACAKCMLDVAFLAIMQRDEILASMALQQAKSAMSISAPGHSMTMGYMLVSGNLNELQGHPANAETAYNTAIALDPLSPEARMNLALLQVRQGELDQARRTEETALSLSATDARARLHQEFEAALAASKAAAAAPARPPN